MNLANMIACFPLPVVAGSSFLSSLLILVSWNEVSDGFLSETWLLSLRQRCFAPSLSPPPRSWILRSGCWAWLWTLWSTTSPEWSSCLLSLLWSAICWASTSEWVARLSSLPCVLCAFSLLNWIVDCLNFSCWKSSLDGRTSGRASLQQVTSHLQTCKSTDPLIVCAFRCTRATSHSRDALICALIITGAWVVALAAAYHRLHH